LVTGRTWSVALVVSAPDHASFDDPFLGRAFADPFFGRIASGALGELGEHGVHLILMRVSGSESRARLLSSLRQGDIDGVLLVSLHATDPLPRMLVDAGVAVVMFGRPAATNAISYVDVDGQAGAGLAVDHLVRTGCKKVATISGPPDAQAGADRLR